MSKIVIKFFRKGIYRSYIFHIVVYDKTTKRGYFLERLGYYNPKSLVTGRKEFVLDFMRLGFWLNRGAILHSSVMRHIAIILQEKEED